MIIGIDLHLRRPSAFCLLSFPHFEFVLVEDEIKFLENLSFEMIVVDAPLSIEKPFRKFERELMKRGYKFLPLTLKSMENLAKKAIKIKRKFKNVYETHPGSLKRIIKTNIREKDLEDAFICAFVGYLLKKGVAKVIEKFIYL